MYLMNIFYLIGTNNCRNFWTPINIFFLPYFFLLQQEFCYMSQASPELTILLPLANSLSSWITGMCHHPWPKFFLLGES